ncbi:DNA polymerase III, delta prime subunit [Fulvimarina manganoxydans]|uniref:DNA polymerase III, delta prime subunit n=1 Tax=Fulvimarina manganoxydans TaxID=937218 RepID=A0A1W2E1J0_9HYPH|nr:DNA polymerase III subunit delta' [Fulvimarina manganoxydans]SMD03643.1 DNA polymerase III, delta prime subunit [Fulvimarina manganoxydans]
MAFTTLPEHDDLGAVVPPKARLALYGHEAAFAELIRARSEKRLHHAWLLQGPRGIGKATAAFAFARLLLNARTADGEGATASFFSEDPVIRQIATDAHPGLIHVTRAAQERGSGFRTQITVEEVRRLARFFHATGASDSYRIAIVDPADDMNRNAANALLKMLEEPPDRALFLIVNHTPGRLLPTIRSRCRALRFDPLDPLTLDRTLAAIAPTLSEQERQAMVSASEGSVRRALVMEEHGGIEIVDALEPLLDADRPDWNGIAALADQLTLKGREASFDLAIDSILSTIAKASEAALDAGDGARAARFAALWQSERARIREAVAYNLDRKQVLLTLYNAYHAAAADRFESA